MWGTTVQVCKSVFNWRLLIFPPYVLNNVKFALIHFCIEHCCFFLILFVSHPLLPPCHTRCSWCNWRLSSLCQSLIITSICYCLNVMLFDCCCLKCNNCEEYVLHFFFFWVLFYVVLWSLADVGKSIPQTQTLCGLPWCLYHECANWRETLSMPVVGTLVFVPTRHHLGLIKSCFVKMYSRVFFSFC